MVPKAAKRGKEAPKPLPPRKAFGNAWGQGFKPSCHMQASRHSLALLRNSVREKSFMALVLPLAGTERAEAELNCR